MKKLRRRVLASALALCLVWTLLPVTARAAETGTWQEAAREPAEGHGGAETPFVITTGEELAYMSLYRGGAYFVLANDIDLSGRKWMPAGLRDLQPGGGSSTTSVRQTLDGRGHTIRGITSDYGGLFWKLDDQAVVKNLTVAAPDSALYTAAIAVFNDGTISNCSAVGSVRFEQDAVRDSFDVQHTGGLVYENRGVIENSVNFVNIALTPAQDDFLCAGGVACRNGGTITGCKNYGAIVSSSSEPELYARVQVGGIAAISGENVTSTIAECSNYAMVANEGCGGTAAGILSGLGSSGEVRIVNCANTGPVTGDESAGGIFGGSGYDSKAKVQVAGCENTGGVSVRAETNETGAAGGIAGELWMGAQGSAKLSGCRNSGTVSGPWQVGGIVGGSGLTAADGAALLSECVNYGAVRGVSGADYDGSLAGGIAGWNGGRIEGCLNDGPVSGNSAGGVAGYNDASGAYGSGEKLPAAITGCANTGAVSGRSAGGVVNDNYGFLYHSHSTGPVSASGQSATAAGVAASNQSGSGGGVISGCYASGTVSVEASNFGSACGITEYNEGTLSDCYFQGTLSSAGPAAANARAIAWQGDGAHAENCYAAATLSGIEEEDAVGVGSATEYNEETYENRFLSTASNCYSTVTLQWNDLARSMTLEQMGQSGFATVLDTAGGAVAARGVWRTGTPYPELTGTVNPSFDHPGNREDSYGDYYATLKTRTVRVFLQGLGYAAADQAPAVTAILPDGTAVAGTWASTCAQLELPLESDGGSVEVRCEGYVAQTIAAELLGSFNYMLLWKDVGDGRPCLRTALIDRTQGNYRSFRNLLTDTLPVYEGSVEVSDLYVDVDWSGGGEGTVTLMQGDREILALQPGWNRNLMLGQLLSESGGTVYIRIDNGRTFLAAVGIKVRQAREETVRIASGDTVESVMPESVEGIGSQKLKIDLGALSGGIVPMELEVEGSTIRGTIGLQIMEAGHTTNAFGKLKDAFKAWDGANPSTEEVDRLIRELDQYGVPKPASASFGIKAKAKVLGYAEGVLINDAAGVQLQFTECGIILGLEGQVSYVQSAALPVIPIPIYFETGAKVEVHLNLPMRYIRETGSLDTEDARMDGKVGIFGGTGVGLPNVLTGGVRGSGALSVESAFPYDAGDSQWTLGISGSFVGCFVGLKGEWTVWKSPSLTVYRNGQWFPGEEPQPLRMEEVSFGRPSQEYLNEESLFLANAAAPLAIEDALVTSRTFLSNVYAYGEVCQSVFSDGTRLMVWVSGDETRELAANRPTLYYSFYDGALWTEPAPVEPLSDGTADFRPVLRTVDDTAYLVWNDADAPYAADAVDGTTMTNTLLSLGVSYARFDPQSRAFTDVSSVTGTDGRADLLADVTAVSGVPTVVWVSSDSADLLFTEGGNVLRSASFENGAWAASDLTGEISCADALAAGEKDGALAVYYSRDLDGDLSDPSDRELFCFSGGEAARVTQNDMADSKPMWENGVLTWYQGGDVCVDGELAPIDAAGDGYQYVPGTCGVDALLYTTSTETTGSLYAVFNDGGGWGAPILLTEQEGYLCAYSGAFLPDGTLSVAANQWAADESACLVLYELTPRCDIAVEDASCDGYTLLSGGTAELAVRLANRGTASVGALRIDVYGGDALIGTSYSAQTLRPGEKSTEDVSFALGAEMPDTLRVEVTPLGYSDSREADNSFLIALSGVDLSVEEVYASNGGGRTFAAVQIANRGASGAADAVVELRLGTADGGEVLASQTVSGLEGRSARMVNFEIDRRLEEGTVLYAVARPVAGESLLGNNSLPAAVQPEQKTGFSYSAAVSAGGPISVQISADNRTDEEVRVCFVAAAYGEGRLLDAKMADAPLAARTSWTRGVELDAPGADCVKVFALDGGHAPLAAAWSCQLPE